MSKKVVIYCRYSSEMQSPKSCDDQEREVRAGLARLGVSAENAVVLRDEARSGTTIDRPGFQQLHQMLARKEVSVVAVDDQSRLSRSDSAIALIQDLVFHGARFISVGDGVDTERTGWELSAQVLGLHNATTIRDLGHRVHRGQEGQIRSGHTAGDVVFGYRTEFLDPNALQQRHRGPKPDKKVCIDEAQATWVRFVFEQFADGLSVTKIADKLTLRKVDCGTRTSKTSWTPERIRRMVANEKYVGLWRWGTTTTIRDSRGKKKQVPVDASRHVVVERPDLRIIDDVLWKKVQARREGAQRKFGAKDGQPPRGPRIHHSAVYPTSLLGGLLFCGICGARMHYMRSGPREYYGCPQHAKCASRCTNAKRVPRQRAEERILEHIFAILRSVPGWLVAVIDATRKRILADASRAPEGIRQDESRLAKLNGQIEKLVDWMAGSAKDGDAVPKRLRALEAEAREVRERLDERRKCVAQVPMLPGDDWFAGKWTELATVLRERGVPAFQLVRRLIDRIEAFAVPPTGQRQDFARLRYRYRGSQVIADLLNDHGLPTTCAPATLVECDAGQSAEVVIDLARDERPDASKPPGTSTEGGDVDAP